ncbi:Putative Dnr-like transcriptional activator [Bradyrhizobium sp. ORS 285]|uniref:Crp/Fnr family transcriptional regulator n=1 Tax=Bradyrhizobium sp. ORS 285 TaxID=115808 RepID=UPI0002407E09|nr:Crp/Fnr family transcriptional regulator [Bradyrhizobium sp. ORS 285]CCD84469.1 putative Dnr-like transcriptional activator [Bradyrhizobium sp. ORS 285]SMX57268.1 Putative Dnr-like transcriptional activator [Bradyrhizobium sp. ORS 285]
MPSIDHLAPGGPSQRLPQPDWRVLARLSPLLAALPAAARLRTRRIDLPRHGSLFCRGDQPRAMFFVLDGEVRLLRRSRVGDDVILQRAQRGFLAEASLDQPAYHCDAVAAQDSTVLAIERQAFADALRRPDMRDKWSDHLARELRRVRAQSERLSLKSARERIVHFIETEGEGGAIALGRSKKDWAAELGITHEALYRALARMQKSGELTVRDTHLRLC